MRPKDLVIPVVIVAVIAVLGVLLVLRGGDDDDSRTSRTSPPVTPIPGATPLLVPTLLTSPIPPAATAPPAPPASTTGASCNGSLANIQRSGRRSFPSAPERIIDPNKTYTALIKTSKGDITASLAAKDAPNTVNSFVFLACNGFFDGLTWHRVVPNFVIQGGDPQGNGTGNPGYRFNNEISPNLKHDAAGVLAMANSGPNTNGSQFYITRAPQPNLDGSYNVFGRVTAGLDFVYTIVMGDKIESISIREG